MFRHPTRDANITAQVEHDKSATVDDPVSRSATSACSCRMPPTARRDGSPAPPSSARDPPSWVSLPMSRYCARGRLLQPKRGALRTGDLPRWVAGTAGLRGIWRRTAGSRHGSRRIHLHRVAREDHHHRGSAGDGETEDMHNQQHVSSKRAWQRATTAHNTSALLSPPVLG